MTKLTTIKELVFFYQKSYFCYSKKNEGAKSAIRSCKSKKDKHYNYQKKKEKRTNNEVLKLHRKLHIRQYVSHKKKTRVYSCSPGGKAVFAPLVEPIVWHWFFLAIIIFLPCIPAVHMFVISWNIILKAHHLHLSVKIVDRKFLIPVNYINVKLNIYFLIELM